MSQDFAFPALPSDLHSRTGKTSEFSVTFFNNGKMPLNVQRTIKML